MKALELCKKYNTDFINLLTDIDLYKTNIINDADFIIKNINHTIDQHKDKPCDIYKIMNDLDYIKSIIDDFTEIVDKSIKMFNERRIKLNKGILEDLDYKKKLLDLHERGKIKIDSNTLNDMYLYKKNIIDYQNATKNDMIDFTKILLHNKHTFTREYRRDAFKIVKNVFENIISKWNEKNSKVEQKINNITHNFNELRDTIFYAMDTYFENYKKIVSEKIDNYVVIDGKRDEDFSIQTRMNNYNLSIYEYDRIFNLGGNNPLPFYNFENIMRNKREDMETKIKSTFENIGIKGNEVANSIENYNRKLEEINNIFNAIFESHNNIQDEISSILRDLEYTFEDSPSPFLSYDYKPMDDPDFYKKYKNKYYYI